MRTHRLLIPGLLMSLGLTLGACGGNSSAATDGVASLSNQGGTGNTTGTTANAKATEAEVLKWVQCMRDQGLDIPDPQVDADGNLRLGIGPHGLGGGGRQGGANGRGGSGVTTTTAAGATPAQPFDRDKFQAAQQVCGRPPQTGGGFSQQDRQAAQDSALKMAQCLRGKGLDVPDPDFSQQGPGGAPPSTVAGAAPSAGSSGADQGGGGNRGRRGGFFGNLDRNDPTVSAAVNACRTELGDAFRRPGQRNTSTTVAP